MMSKHDTHQEATIKGGVTDPFSQDTEGLPDAIAPEVVVLHPDKVFELRAEQVRKRINDATVKMLAYNRSIPGSTMKVAQGSEVTIHFSNDTDLETTVHWHGLRLENRFDGVPQGAHQGMMAPVPVAGSFTYRVRFPDPGLYWYHPHLREDYTQEMGLYGPIIVVPTEEGYWSPANREMTLTIDDLLLEGGRIAPFSRTLSDHTAMGRFGNVMLTSGETSLQLSANQGEVVRLYLVNTANVRTFNVRLPGARMKLVGGDNERIEHEEFVEEALLLVAEMPGMEQMENPTGGQQPVAIEWEDDMEEINRMSTPQTMSWKLMDGETGAVNQDIDWSFTVGEQVKVSIVNASPMQHPIHFHGQRFLVLSRNGTPNENLVWKDTVLVPAGEAVDILVDMSNPGGWMVHCHIAEHLESGMMFSYQVQERRV